MMPNTTTTGWNPEPQGRGTLGLVWSCLATIFICVWSTLHPNLPSDSDGASLRMWYQAGYIAIGLLAPEWLAYVALGDLEDVRKIKSRVNISCPRSIGASSLTLKSAPNGH
jgi:hypothetical protein